MVFLLKLVHGNSTSVRQMIAEFKTYWCQYVKINELQNVRSNISKKQLIKKIQNIASKGNNQQLGKLCYTVNTDILAKYGVPDLELASGLTYPVPKEKGNASSSEVFNSTVGNTFSIGENVNFTEENTNSIGKNVNSTEDNTIFTRKSKKEQCVVQKSICIPLDNKKEPMEVD